MRLHHLELQAFLAFPGHERIDFDALNDAGLFLLTGRTGAGKSTILDAIAFALYGQVPGTRPVKGLRSTHADAQTPTEVVLELTLSGRRLRVRRRPEQERARLRGEGTTQAKAEVTLSEIEHDGTETVISNRLDEVGHELRGLLGMTPQQFCQVVLLPQGEFQQFLHAKSDERQKLLAELFDVTRFEGVERWLKTERDAARSAAETAMRSISDLVSRAAQVVNPAGLEDGPTPPEDWAAAPSRAVEWIDTQAVVAEAEADTATEADRQAVAAREKAEAALSAAEALTLAQTQARTAATELAEHEQGRPDRDRAAEALRQARRAAPAVPLLDAWRARRGAAQTAEAAAVAALDAAREAGVPVPDGCRDPDTLAALAGERRRSAGAAEALLPLEKTVRDAAEKCAALGARRRALSEQVQDLRTAVGDAAEAHPGLLEAAARAQAAVAALPGLTATADAAVQRADAAQRRDELAAAEQEAQSKQLEVREAAVRATEALHALQRRRLDGFAAELAQKLQPGEACAVCGAREHPAPAPPPEGGLVDQQQLEVAETAASTAVETRDAGAEALSTLREQLAAARSAAGADEAGALKTAATAAARAAAEAAARAATLADATTALQQHDERAETVATNLRRSELELERIEAQHADGVAALELDRARVDAARAGSPSLRQRVADLTGAAEAADRATAALQAANRAAAEAQDARGAVTAAATELGLDTPEELEARVRDAATCEELDQQIRTWDEQLVALRTTAERVDLRTAAEQPTPEIPALATALRDAKSAEGTAQDARTRAVNRRTELRNLSTRLSEAIAACAPVLERRDTVCELAELALGRSTSNRLRISLSAYVLTARLEEVAAAATLRLLTMTDGRYRIEHADDTAVGRSRGGLDLRIHDAWSGDSRAPASLSGGETFMASLALALGLADTVTARSGGLRLDTLFVDEGFGTLDDEGTLDDVLAALDALREGGRTVGLVSHVAELRQRITTQVRVDKRRTGSTIVAAAPVTA